MKYRQALKILRNINRESRCKYNKPQVRKAVKRWIKRYSGNPKDRLEMMLTFISGGCHDTFRWRNPDWPEPPISYDLACVIGEYLV